MDAFSKVKQELSTDDILSAPGLLEELNKYSLGVRAEIWRLFFLEKEKGTFIVKVLFFKKDMSDLVENLLRKWIGNPVTVV